MLSALSISSGYPVSQYKMFHVKHFCQTQDDVSRETFSPKILEKPSVKHSTTQKHSHFLTIYAPQYLVFTS